MATDIGDLRRLSFTLTDPDGNPVSSDSMNLTVTLPDATQVDAGVITPDSPGQYHFDYLATQAGRHVAHWSGTGTNPGAQTEVFDVVDPDPPYMFSVESARNQLNITGDGSDEELRGYIESATAVVERVTGQAMVKRTITEEHEITSNSGRMALSLTPIVSLTSVAQIDEHVTWDPASLHVNPTTGVVSTTFLTGLLQLRGRIQVTYVAGYTEIPGNYLLAAKMIVEHLWQTKRGTRGPVRPGGMEDTSLAPGFAFAVPNRALELLGAGMPGFA